MAFVKDSSKMKRSILAFIEHMLTKTLYVAFEDLLNPCCENSILSVEAVCDEADNYTVTVTTTNTIGFLGKGGGQIIVNGVSFAVGTVVEPNQVVFEEVDVAAGTYDVQVDIFLPTNSESSKGVFNKLGIFENVEFPAC